jgi:hypothetical protein
VSPLRRQMDLADNHVAFASIQLSGSAPAEVPTAFDPMPPKGSRGQGGKAVGLLRAVFGVGSLGHLS